MAPAHGKTRRTPPILAAAVALAAALAGPALSLGGCASLDVGRLAPPASAAGDPKGHPLVGQVAFAGREELAPFTVAWAQLEERVLAADLLLLGETHDDPEHHRLQARVLAFLLARGARPRLIFEMMDADQQTLLDGLTLARDWRPEDVFVQLAWAQRGWRNIEDYRPLLALAAEHHLPVVAANLSVAQMRDLFAHGGEGWPSSEQREVGLTPPLSVGQRLRLFEDLRLAHGGEVPARILAKMAAIQQSRDGQFARLSAARPPPAGDRPLRPGPRAVLIAGRDHTRLDRGVPWHLARQSPADRVFSLAFLAAVPGQMRAGEVPELKLHDAVVWTPPRALEEAR